MDIKEPANTQQVLVLQENALVIVLRPRTQPQVVRSAPVVLALLVSCLPSLPLTFVDEALTTGIMMLTVSTDACTCEKASDGGLLPTETDFTGKA